MTSTTATHVALSFKPTSDIYPQPVVDLLHAEDGEVAATQWVTAHEVMVTIPGLPNNLKVAAGGYDVFMDWSTDGLDEARLMGAYKATLEDHGYRLNDTVVEDCGDYRLYEVSPIN